MAEPAPVRWRDPSLPESREEADLRRLAEAAQRRRARLGPTLTTGLPLLVSVALHALALVAAALVALTVAPLGRSESRPSVSLEFNEATLGIPRDRDATRLLEEFAAERPVAAVESARGALGPGAGPAVSEQPRLEALGNPGAGEATLDGPAVTSPVLALSRPIDPAALRPGTRSVQFAGLEAASVGSVVYCVDVSGPMVGALPVVMSELERSVDGLTPSQRFNVILFRRGSAGVETLHFQRGLVRATPQAKRDLRAWLRGAQAEGRSAPLEGLRAAIDLQPQVVFLLSRGIERTGGGLWGQGSEQTLTELERLNPSDPRTGGRRIVIKTIQFLDEDPTGTMQAIGRLHGTDQAGAGYTVQTAEGLRGR